MRQSAIVRRAPLSTVLRAGGTALAAIVLVAAALRFATLGVQSFSDDELFTAWLTRMSVRPHAGHRAADGGHAVPRTTSWRGRGRAALRDGRGGHAPVAGAVRHAHGARRLRGRRRGRLAQGRAWPPPRSRPSAHSSSGTRRRRVPTRSRCSCAPSGCCAWVASCARAASGALGGLGAGQRRRARDALLRDLAGAAGGGLAVADALGATCAGGRSRVPVPWPPRRSRWCRWPCTSAAPCAIPEGAGIGGLRQPRRGDAEEPPRRLLDPGRGGGHRPRWRRSRLWRSSWRGELHAARRSETAALAAGLGALLRRAAGRARAGRVRLRDRGAAW